MTSHSKSALFAAAVAAAIALPATVNAALISYSATLTDNQVFTGVSLIGTDDTIQFEFTALDDLTISSFSVSGTGNNSEGDLHAIRFGFLPATDTAFTTFGSPDTAAAAFGFLPGLTLMAGNMFSVYFTDGIVNSVGLTLSFRTEAPAAVPLPAAGILMLPVMLFGGFAAWRRRRRTMRLMTM